MEAAPAPAADPAPPALRQQPTRAERAAAASGRRDVVSDQFALTEGGGGGAAAADPSLSLELQDLSDPRPAKKPRAARRKRNGGVPAPDVESPNAKALRLFFASPTMLAVQAAAAPFLRLPPALSEKGRSTKVTGVVKRSFQVRARALISGRAWPHPLCRPPLKLLSRTCVPGWPQRAC